MPRNLEDILDTFSPESLERIEVRSQELIAEHMTLQALRKSLNITQDELADRLQLQQGSVSKLEKRSDMRVSTLRNYVSAMGGSLELVARFPGHAPVRIEGVDDLLVPTV